MWSYFSVVYFILFAIISSLHQFIILEQLNWNSVLWWLSYHWNITNLSAHYWISGHYISCFFFLPCVATFGSWSKVNCIPFCWATKSKINLQFYGRSMAELRVLRLFGNPLEFLPEILPLHNLRHLSLANIRIEATENIKSVNVQIEVIAYLLVLRISYCTQCFSLKELYC